MRAPLLALAALLSGCAAEGTPMQTWWGPLDSSDGGTPFASGGSSEVRGLVHRQTTEGTPRDVLEVVVVDASVSCGDYAHWLASMGALRRTLLSELDASDQIDALAAWTCGEIAALSTELFGGEGRYRALHLLAEAPYGVLPDGVFRAAPVGATTEFGGAELLDPGTYVARWYERGPHGAELLPEGADVASWASDDLDPVTSCEAAASRLMSESLDGRETYPDRDSMALQSATHRWYHHHTTQEEIGLWGGEPLAVGLTLPDWEVAATDGAVADVTVFTTVARAPDAFPYDQALLSVQHLPLEPCPDLGEAPGVVWDELVGFGAGGYGSPPSDSCTDSVHPACWQSDPSANCAVVRPLRPSSWLALLFAGALLGLRRLSRARP